MKKIISLIAATTLLSSLCSFNVSAKDEIIDVSATQIEMTDDELAAIKKLNRKVKLDFDPAEFTAYKVTFNVDNAPLSNEDDWNAVMAFEASLTFPNDTCYYSAQSTAVFKDSFFAATGVLDAAKNLYRATFVKNDYDSMKIIESSKIDNAIVMAVVAKPGTVVDVKATYTEWYDDTSEKVPHTINCTTPKLTLGKATVDVTGIKLDKESLKFDLNGTKTETLTATVEPENATDKTVTWSIAEEDKEYVEINTKDNTCSITALKVTPEDKTVTVTATAGKASASCKITVVDTTPKPDSESSQKEITKVDGKTLFKIGTIFNNAPATKRISVYSTSLKDTRESTKTIADFLTVKLKRELSMLK